MSVRRKLILAALVLLVPLAAAFLWTRTDSFRDWLKARLIKSVSGGGITAEMAGVEIDLWHRNLALHSLKLRSGDREPPFLDIDRVEISFGLGTLLGRQTRLDRLIITGPVVRVLRSEDGRSNLDGIDWSAYVKSSSLEGGWSVGEVAIDRGIAEAEWAARNFSLRARHLAFTIRPEAGAFHFDIQGNDLAARMGKRTLEQVSISTQVTLRSDRAEVLEARLSLPGCESAIRGEITLKNPPAYRFEVTSSLRLDRLAERLELTGGLRGQLELRGRIEGMGDDYRFAGLATSKAITGAGIEVTGGSLESRSRRPLNLITTLFGLSHDEERHPADAELAGSLHVNHFSRSFLAFDGVECSVDATPFKLSLGKIRAQIFGGTVSGNGSWSREEGARFSGIIQGVHSSTALAAAGYGDPALHGLINGPITLLAQPLSRGISGGSAALQIAADPGATPAGAIAATGNIQLAFTPGGSNIQHANLQLGGTEAQLQGSVTWTGDFTLDLNARTPSLEELEGLRSSLKLDLAAATNGIMDHLGGRAEFDGRLERRAGRYAVQGDLLGWDWPLKTGRLDSWKGGILLTPAAVQLSRTAIRLADGSQIDLDLQHDLAAPFDTRGSAVLRDTDAAALARALGYDLPVTGRTAGTINLTRTKPAVDLTAQIIISNGALTYGKTVTPFRRLTGRLEAKQDRFQVQEGKMEIAAGAIEIAGGFDRGRGGLDLRLSGNNLRLATLFPAPGGKPGPVEGSLRFDIHAGGTLSEPELTGNVRIWHVFINGNDAGQLLIHLEPQAGSLKLTASLLMFGQSLTIDGSYKPSDPSGLVTAHAQFKDFDLKPFIEALRPVPKDLQARISGDARVSYPIKTGGLQVSVALPELAVQFGDYSVRNNGPLIADWNPPRLTLQPLRMSGTDTNFTLAGGIERSGAPAEAANGPTRMDLSLDGQVNLQVLRIFAPNLGLGGSATVKATLRGTMQDPRVSGLAELKDVTARRSDLPIGIEQGSGRIRFTSNQALVEEFRAQANGGELRVTGGMLIKNLVPDRWQFNINAEGLPLRYPEGIRSIVDANLALRGSRELQILSGTANIRKAELTDDADVEGWVTSGGKGGLRMPQLSGGPAWPIALDLRIQGLETISFRREAFDAVGSTWLRVSGQLSDPHVSGRASVSRGHLTFLNREYQITRGNLTLPDRPGDKPRFDLEAETDIGGYRVIVTLTGTPDRFQATPHSEPALPPQQVLSLMTTGDIGNTADTTQLASQTTSALATALITEAISKRIELGTRYFGINRFQLAPLTTTRGSDPSARISVGRQVTRDLSITYSTNVASTQEQVIVVEYRLSNRFSLVGTRDQDGKFSLDFRIRKRF